MNQQDFGIKRVSVDSSGNEANGDSRNAAISGDGRFVAFESEADNLVAGDTNEAVDVFLHNLETGATTRVSVASAGSQGNDVSRSASISADGRFVVFSSEADNLVEGDVGDRLSGDLGDALLLACGGQDTFVLAVGGGNDTISGFEDGVARLEVTGGLTFS